MHYDKIKIIESLEVIMIIFNGHQLMKVKITKIFPTYDFFNEL